MNIISARKWKQYIIIGVLLLSFLGIGVVLLSHNTNIIHAQNDPTNSITKDESSTDSNNNADNITPEMVVEDRVTPAETLPPPLELKEEVTELFNNQIEQRENELEKYNTFYDKLYSEAQKDFDFASEEYNSSTKEINLNNPSTNELLTLYSLTLARYSLLNMKLYESREQLTNDLDLLYKSGFENEKIRIKIDTAMKGVIANQARLEAFEYAIETIQDNEESKDLYSKYLIDLSQKIDSEYENTFEELSGIIDVYLF